MPELMRADSDAEARDIAAKHFPADTISAWDIGREHGTDRITVRRRPLAGIEYLDEINQAEAIEYEMQRSCGANVEIAAGPATISREDGTSVTVRAERGDSVWKLLNKARVARGEMCL